MRRKLSFVIYQNGDIVVFLFMKSRFSEDAEENVCNFPRGDMVREVSHKVRFWLLVFSPIAALGLQLYFIFACLQRCVSIIISRTAYLSQLAL